MQRLKGEDLEVVVLRFCRLRYDARCVDGTIFVLAKVWVYMYAGDNATKRCANKPGRSCTPPIKLQAGGGGHMSATIQYCVVLQRILVPQPTGIPQSFFFFLNCRIPQSSDSQKKGTNLMGGAQLRPGLLAHGMDRDPHVSHSTILYSTIEDSLPQRPPTINIYWESGPL
jgi:hypothetical protein